MRCEETRERRLQARLNGESDAELDAHLSECTACRERVHSDEALDRLLKLEVPHTPGPGFDTRFFALLDAERSKQKRSRGLRWLFALVPITAALGLVWMKSAEPKPQPQAQPSVEAADALSAELAPDDIDLAMDLDLIEELPVVEQLDDLETLDMLEDVDDAELEQLAAEAK